MCSNGSGKSETLLRLAERLRHNNSNNTSLDASNTNATHSKALDYSVNRHGNNRAAVLICLFEDDNGEIRVILTKRSSALNTHTGEVALPGGRREEGDDNDAQTALREASEEIGLDPLSVEVVTVLQPLFSKRKIVVSPVIGILWDKNAFKPVLNPAEVESIFDAPLEMFLKDENHRVKQHEWMGHNYYFHYFHYKDDQNRSYVIWAFTATVLIETASIVYQRPPRFENTQPKFWGRSHL